jgi:hypothetical protein
VTARDDALLRALVGASHAVVLRLTDLPAGAPLTKTDLRVLNNLEDAMRAFLKAHPELEDGEDG